METHFERCNCDNHSRKKYVYIKAYIQYVFMKHYFNIVRSFYARLSVKRKNEYLRMIFMSEISTFQL